MNISSVQAIAITGMQADIVTVQGFISQGLPYFSIIGLPDTALSQARERVKSACKTTRIKWPQTRITVNLSPASLPKHGSGYDLSIATCIFGALHYINPALTEDTVIMGELALDGSVLPITSVLPIMIHARDIGIKRVILPQENIEEARIISGVEIIGVSHLHELLRLLGAPDSVIGTHSSHISNPIHTTNKSTQPITTTRISDIDTPRDSTDDYKDIIGLEDAKWALEIAATGGHHVLMQGPPGVGKSMLAHCLPSVLPPLTPQESIELACIQSAYAQPIHLPLSTHAPFIALHHNASVKSLTGGIDGGRILPGAMSLAHHGVLFLDEAPEFSRPVIQALRVPLESGEITVSRVKGSVTYPAKFQLILAQNPCSCGQLWNSGGICTCTPTQLRRYRQKISTPLLDRIDIKIDIHHEQTGALHASHSHSYSPLSDNHALWDSEHMRMNVQEARKRCEYRYRNVPWSTNQQARPQWLMDMTASPLLKRAQEQLKEEMVTLRGIHKILRIAWSIADLVGKNQPDMDDFQTAENLYLPES